MPLLGRRIRTPRTIASLGLALTLLALGGVQQLAPAASAATTTPGSAAVGTTTYAVPSGAIFAVPGGGTSGSGTSSSPYQSAQTAIDKAPSGATIVLRKGLYREQLSIPFNKKLTIQSYPNEAVWLDGSRVVTGWLKVGTTWSAPWSTILDDKVSMTEGADERSRYLESGYPMAGDPHQVWVGGVEQTQVPSVSAVTAGKFYVDRTAKRLYIGSDPTGKTVDSSALTRALKIQGAGSTIRGIGIRRYGTPLSTKGTVSFEVNDLTFENVVVADNATIGFFGWGDRATFRNVSVTGNGILGLQGDSAPGMKILSSVFRNNNDEHFRATPTSGGVKLGNTDGVRVADSVFDRNVTTGLWFDVSMRNVQVVGNRVTDNGAAGIEFEISGHAIISNNYIARNREGIFLFNANDVDLWNNTLDKNVRSIQVLQDERRQPNSALATTVPWVTKNIEIHNSAIVYGTNTCPVLTQDLTQKWTGNQFDIGSNGNAFHRVSSTSPSRFACWANGSAGTKSFPSIVEWRTNTYNDKVSKAFEGTNILTSTGALTSTASTSTAAVPLGLPSNVATAIGRPAGEKMMGAYVVR